MHSLGNNSLLRVVVVWERRRLCYGIKPLNCNQELSLLLSLPSWVRYILVPVTRIELRRVQSEENYFSVDEKQQETDILRESEDGSVEFDTPTDDEEITIPSQDNKRKVPNVPDSDIRDEQTLSNTQREDWLLPTETLHGARPRQTGRECPPVIDNRPLRDAAGNRAVRNPSRTFLLSPGWRILMEEEVFTPPRGGGASGPRASGCNT